MEQNQTLAERKFKMYGCDIDEFVESVKQSAFSVRASKDRIPMAIMSILSDSQEMMAHGDTESARQYINRAKYLLSQTTDEMKMLDEEISKRKLSKLNAEHEAYREDMSRTYLYGLRHAAYSLKDYDTKQPGCGFLKASTACTEVANYLQGIPPAGGTDDDLKALVYQVLDDADDF